ncbi:ATP phosphoribosyltransferase regulatory subunit, partial [Butyricicoccus sp. 1XD8-22]
FEEAVVAFDLPKTKSDALLEFINEATNIESIQQIEKYVSKNDALLYMRQLAQIMEAADLSEYVSFDFTLSSHMNYYTGMLFEVFAEGSGFPLGNGGRYDGLLQRFGNDVGATGFGLRVDRLLEILPALQKEDQTSLVIFENAQFTKALGIANSLRTEGKLVTLQAKDGLLDEQAFIKLFDEVVYVSQEDVEQ